MMQFLVIPSILSQQIFFGDTRSDAQRHLLLEVGAKGFLPPPSPGLKLSHPRHAIFVVLKESSHRPLNFVVGISIRNKNHDLVPLANFD